MFMMIDGEYRRVGAGHRDRFGNVDGNSAKPQLPRLLAEIKATDGKNGREIESCRQKISTAQTYCLIGGASGQRP
jgi:hypothetical protein